MKVSAIILVITDIISISLSLAESFISLLNQRWPRSYSYLVIKDLWSILYEHTLIDLKEETLKGVQCETHLFGRIFYRAIIFMVMAPSHSLPTAHLSCCSNGYFYNLYTAQARLCIFSRVQWIQSRHYRIRSPAVWDDGGLVQLLLHCCYILWYWRICSYCWNHILSSNDAALQNVWES